MMVTQALFSVEVIVKYCEVQNTDHGKRTKAVFRRPCHCGVVVLLGT